MIDLHNTCSERINRLSRRRENEDQIEALAKEHIELAKKTLRAFHEDHNRQGKFYRDTYGAGTQCLDLQLPDHPGFAKLSTIYEHRGQIAKAIALAETAKAQGWKGDWDARLNRLEKKRYLV